MAGGTLDESSISLFFVALVWINQSSPVTVTQLVPPTLLCTNSI